MDDDDVDDAEGPSPDPLFSPFFMSAAACFARIIAAWSSFVRANSVPDCVFFFFCIFWWMGSRGGRGIAVRMENKEEKY